MCDACDRADEQRTGGIDRRLVLAGGLAAGVSPFLARAAGAQEADPTTTTTTSTTSTTTSTTAPSTTTTTQAEKIDLEGRDAPAHGAMENDFGFDPPRPANEVHRRPIMFPIVGDVYWTDTYLYPRSGGRLHEGQDLMAAKMQKLVATCDGTIVELRHQSSGNSLYLKGDDGYYYCYLHINNDDPGTDNGANQRKYAFPDGIVEGKRVLKGEHIAYVGDSGNAENSGSHCHIEIRVPHQNWYNAAAVNAKYSLESAEPAKVRPKVPDEAFAPHDNASQYALRSADDFLGSLPSAAWFTKAVEDLEGAAIGLDDFIESNVLAQYGATNQSAPVIRLYLGYFLRIPDYSGMDYWFRQVRAGRPLDLASSQFAGSSEFINRYGELDNEGFLIQIYNNLFDRDPDPGGLDYWKRRLDGGAKRGWVMRQMCESSEYRTKTAAEVAVTQVYAGMLRRAPDPSGYSYWANKVRTSESGLRQLIQSIRTGTSYANRF